jgi:hypothetical protein
MVLKFRCGFSFSYRFFYWRGGPAELGHAEGLT